MMSAINKIANRLQAINSRLEEAEKLMSDIEYKIMENNDTEEKKKKKKNAT